MLYWGRALNIKTCTYNLYWDEERGGHLIKEIQHIISNTLQGNFRFYHRFWNAKKSGWRNQQYIPGCYFLPSLSVHNASDCNRTKVRHVLNPEVLQLGMDYFSVNSQWHDLAWSLMWLPVEHKLNCLAKLSLVLNEQCGILWVPESEL